MKRFFYCSITVKVETFCWKKYSSSMFIYIAANHYRYFLLEFEVVELHVTQVLFRSTVVFLSRLPLYLDHVIASQCAWS